MLDPVDPQNVPRAIGLIRATGKLNGLPTADLKPSEQKTHNASAVLGEWAFLFVLPFVSLSMLLSEQLESLSCRAHLTFALYSINGSAFMPPQLYHDIMATIKNIFFCVAKQKILDPDAPFYLCLVGTDRLEILFSTVRTMTHDRNADFLQLIERIAAAFDITIILCKHPDWSSGHHQLKSLTDAGADHINPRSWLGDVKVGGVSLHAAWTGG
ncbi:hypothetical protein BOTBODRAFT_116692, partial [Botryobasidium botryosum FD-172 SS1]